MVQAIPEGVGNVVPYLCVRGAAKAIEFYQAAFGAEVMSTMPMGDGLIGHADLKIGSARVYLADEMPGWGAVKSPASLKGTSANIHLWVEDCDATFASAVAAGAKVAMPLVDQFWGDRYGMVIDPFGHAWAISSHKEDLTPEEMMRRGQEAMAQMAQSAPGPEADPDPNPTPTRSKRTRPASAPSRKSSGPKATPKKATAVKPTPGGETKTPPKVKHQAKPGSEESKKAKTGKSKKAKSGKPKKDRKSKKSKKDKKRKKKSKG